MFNTGLPEPVAPADVECGGSILEEGTNNAEYYARDRQTGKTTGCGAP